jgi:hypothetical protein
MAKSFKQSIFDNPQVWIPTFAIGAFIVYKYGREAIEKVIPNVIDRTEKGGTPDNPFNYASFLEKYSLAKKGGSMYTYATSVEKAGYLRDALTRVTGEDTVYLNRFAATVPSQRDFAQIVKSYTSKFGTDLYVDIKEGAGFRSSIPTGGLNDGELKEFLKTLYARPVIR